MASIFDKAKPVAQEVPVVENVAPVVENVAPVVAEKVVDANGLSIKNAATREKDAEKRALLEELLGIVKTAVESGKLEKRALEVAQKLRPSFFGISNVPANFAPKDTTKAQDNLLAILGKTELAAVAVGDTFTEMDSFSKIRAGRKETREMCNSLIRDVKKFKAIYIDFDEKNATYKVVAIGAAPANWQGYVPVKRVNG